jgi:hypothetical protein
MNLRTRSRTHSRRWHARNGGALVVGAALWSCAAPQPIAPMASSEQVRRAGDLDLERSGPTSDTLISSNLGQVDPAQQPAVQDPKQNPDLIFPPKSAPAQTPPEPVQSPPAPVQATPEPIVLPPRRSAISGYLSSSYRGRWTSNDHDHDLYEIASIDYDDPRTPWFSAHVMGRLAADLDGQHGSPSVFSSIEDTYNEDLVGTLYDAYADIHPKDALASVRIGRQLDYLTPELAYFDGASLHSRPLGTQSAQVGVYGGIPVHNYDSSHSGDTLFGTYAEANPWKGGRARADWMHFQDDGQFGSLSNDLLGLGVWESTTSGWTADAQYTHLDSKPRDLRLHADYASADGRSSMRASIYRLFRTQFEQALGLDPFSSALQEYFPFTQGTIGMTQSVSKRVDLDGGIDLRRVEDSSDIGENNRDWERYYVTANVGDVFVSGLTASVTADFWDGDGRDIQTWGADFSRDFGKAWQGSAGSYFSLYKYDIFNNSERDDVRTYYVRAKWIRSDALTFAATIDFENDDFEQYETLRLEAIWHF